MHEYEFASLYAYCASCEGDDMGIFCMQSMNEKGRRGWHVCTLCVPLCACSARQASHLYMNHHKPISLPTLTHGDTLLVDKSSNEADVYNISAHRDEHDHCVDQRGENINGQRNHSSCLAQQTSYSTQPNQQATHTKPCSLRTCQGFSKIGQGRLYHPRRTNYQNDFLGSCNPLHDTK